MLKRYVASFTLLAALGCAALAHAEELSRPKGPVILTLSGKITHSNAGGVAQFDLPMLEALQQRSATMETPWTKGRVTFDGPLGRALLEAVGAQGSVLKVTALNDYAVDVPVVDLTDHDTMLATRLDGKPMNVRDKGPVFIIYPFDKEPQLFNETYFSRSVWQVKSIDVE